MNSNAAAQKVGGPKAPTASSSSPMDGSTPTPSKVNIGTEAPPSTSPPAVLVKDVKVGNRGGWASISAAGQRPGGAGALHGSAKRSDEGNNARIARDVPPPKKKLRGSYKCTRCGMPKKGHICPMANVAAPPPPPSRLPLPPAHRRSASPCIVTPIKVADNAIGHRTSTGSPALTPGRTNNPSLIYGGHATTPPLPNPHCQPLYDTSGGNRNIYSPSTATTPASTWSNDARGDLHQRQQEQQQEQQQRIHALGNKTPNGGPATPGIDGFDESLALQQSMASGTMQLYSSSMASGGQSNLPGKNHHLAPRRLHLESPPPYRAPPPLPPSPLPPSPHFPPPPSSSSVPFMRLNRTLRGPAGVQFAHHVVRSIHLSAVDRCLVQILSSLTNPMDLANAGRVDKRWRILSAKVWACKNDVTIDLRKWERKKGNKGTRKEKGIHNADEGEEEVAEERKKVLGRNSGNGGAGYEGGIGGLDRSAEDNDFVVGDKTFGGGGGGGVSTRVVDGSIRSLSPTSCFSPLLSRSEECVAEVVSLCPTLQTLHLVGVTVTDRLLAAIVRERPHLEHVLLSPSSSASGVTPLGLQHFCSSSTHLSTLVLHDCRSLPYLDLKSLSLTSLHLFGCTNMRKWNMQCPNLKELAIDTFQHDILPPVRENMPSASEANVHVQKSTYLQQDQQQQRQHLHSSSSSFFSSPLSSVELISFLRQVAESSPSSLCRLHVSIPLLTDQALSSLFSFSPSSLTHLSLTHAPFLSDEALITTVLDKCPNLTFLDLAGNTMGVTDALLRRLMGRATKCRRKIEYLGIANCFRISKKMVQDIVYIQKQGKEGKGMELEEEEEGEENCASLPNLRVFDAAYTLLDSRRRDDFSFCQGGNCVDEERAAALAAEEEEEKKSQTLPPFVSSLLHYSPSFSSSSCIFSPFSSLYRRLPISEVSCDGRIDLLLLRHPTLSVLSVKGCTRIQNIEKRDAPKLKKIIWGE